MPKTIWAQTNFTGGEISPRLLGRTDLARYANALLTGENVVVLEQGGARLKPGTDLTGSSKFADRPARLIPFVVSPTLAYDLEFGDLYVRVWLADVMVLELVSPFTVAMLPALDYTQGADTMFIASGLLPIYRLQRFGDAVWNLEPTPFDPVPFDEIGARFPVVVTLSSVALGSGRSATAATAIWNLTDIGRHITAGGGRALVTAFISTTVLTVTIEQPFVSTTLPSNGWVLTGSPQGTITPGAAEEGNPISLTYRTTPVLEPAQPILSMTDDGAGTATATISAHGWTSGDTIVFAGNAPSEYDTVATINVIDANHVSYPHAATGAMPTALGTGQRLQFAGAGAWRASDVGKYVKINGGLVKITSIASPAVADGTAEKKLTSTTDSAPGAWSLNAPVWNDFDGYPVTVTLFEQRLWAANTPSSPQGLWGSRIGLYLDFTIGIADDDAISYTIASDEVNPIQYLNSGKDFLAFTFGPVFAIKGGVEKPITPTNISIKPQTKSGTAQVRPESVGTAVLFAQRGGKKLLSLTYQVMKDRYVDSNIGAFSEHIPGAGLVAISVQTMPEPIVWLLLADGTLGALTLSEEQQVVAFTRCTTDGFVESISTIPDPSASIDVTHILVRRTINGTTMRYRERLNFDARQDCRITGTHAASATITGLGALEAKVVSVVADGVFVGTFTVSGGAVTIGRPCLAYSVGLPYVGTLALLPPDPGSGLGTSQGQANSQHKVYVRVLESIGCTVNGQELPGFAHFDDQLLDRAPQPVSGLIEISEYGWAPDAPLVLTQPRPYPWQILAVLRAFTSNAG